MGLRYLEITGGVPLGGEIAIQGSKNAVLPILAACMLGDGPCVIKNCPKIGDVDDLLVLLGQLGCQAEREDNTVRIDGVGMNRFEVDGREAARIRSSILFLGPLLGKMGKAVLPLPGGCAIGKRPIDLHLTALEQLGAQFQIIAEARVSAKVQGLCGAAISLAFPSVGATENIILAAVLAKGETVICNAAREPEIDELCAFLNMRGAQIERDRNGNIRICGVKRLRPVTWQLRADRIVTGTYLLAVMAAGGQIRITNFPQGDLDALLPVLRQMGAQFWADTAGFCLEAKGECLPVPYLETAPYPGFPTDLQSPLMAVLCRARGKSVICERIFESRFKTASELRKMGAWIDTDGSLACIYGREALHGAVLEAPDLRGGAALVLASLAASGKTWIYQTEYIERGYEDICRDLQMLGAKIQKVR